MARLDTSLLAQVQNTFSEDIWKEEVIMRCLICYGLLEIERFMLWIVLTRHTIRYNYPGLSPKASTVEGQWAE